MTRKQPVKVYRKRWTITDRDPFDAAFGDLRSGTISAGSLVKIWIQDEGRHAIGHLEWWYGAPSFKEA